MNNYVVSTFRTFLSFTNVSVYIFEYNVVFNNDPVKYVNHHTHRGLFLVLVLNEKFNYQMS